MLIHKNKIKKWRLPTESIFDEDLHKIKTEIYGDFDYILAEDDFKK